MENQEIDAVEAEETNESAAQGAIEVSENKAELVKIEDKLIVPVIPETLNVNGVELNIKKLAKEVAEAKKMKIDGLGDKKGYDDAVATLKALSKLRTSSDNWRQAVMKPVLKFQRELKAKVDEAGKLCEGAEAHLKAIIKPIDDAVEIARQEAETKKDELAKERVTELISLGGVLDANGDTLNFPLDGALFVLRADLRTYTPEAYDLVKKPIQEVWDAEQARLQEIADKEEQEKSLLKSQVEDLNAERTEFRKEQLEMKGFEINPISNNYAKEATEITEEQIMTLNAAEWKALLNPPAPIVEDTADEELPSLNDSVDYTPVTEKAYSGFRGSSSTIKDFSSEFEDVIEPVYAENVTELPETEEVLVSVEKVITRTLVFSEVKPFVEFTVGNGFSMLVFPNEYALSFERTKQVATEGSVNDQLKFELVKN